MSGLLPPRMSLLGDDPLTQRLRQPQRYSHPAFTLPPVLQALQDNAAAGAVPGLVR